MFKWPEAAGELNGDPKTLAVSDRYAAVNSDSALVNDAAPTTRFTEPQVERFSPGDFSDVVSTNL